MSATTSLLPPVLTRLYAEYPELNVLVLPGTSADLCEQIANGSLDAAIAVQPPFALNKHCEWRTVFEEQMVIIGRPDQRHSDAHELLQNEPFIRYTRSVTGGQLADRYLRDHALHPKQRL
ncbi:LysR family transcriptional regulator, partial [Alcaligenaceae bacterium]|nr:LysR family transcriptional regulator [Alcaligenaceae bacterium]